MYIDINQLAVTFFKQECYPIVKVAFSLKGLMRLSFLQRDEPNYFLELEF